MKLSRTKVTKAIAGLFLAGTLSAPAWAARTAVPGTLNYVEGQVAIDDQAVDAKSVGSAILQPGQSLSTNNGKAEVLLTPGVFLRLDDQSSARMVSTSLTSTGVSLDQGRALVEVSEIHHENNLRVTADGFTTQVVKTGLYDFDAARAQVRVFSGKAVVFDGDRKVKLDGGHEVNLTSPGTLKSQKFDKQEYNQTDLYRWSSLRSSYLAEANVDAARLYVVNGGYGPGWFGAGWYWDPWFGSYTYIPADGIFYSPFGWGFYSPLVIYRTPVFFGGHPFVHHFGPGFRPSVVGTRPFGNGAFQPGFRSGPVVSHREAPAFRGNFGGGNGHFGGRR